MGTRKKAILATVVFYLLSAKFNLALAVDYERGLQVRKIFVELLDATDPNIDTSEKKRRIINTLTNNRQNIKELFFISNIEMWNDANIRISYEKVKSHLKLGPFVSLLYYQKEQTDHQQSLANFNEFTHNVFPSLAKGVIQHFPLPHYLFGTELINLPGIKQLTDHEVEIFAAGLNDYIASFRLEDSEFSQELFNPPSGFDLQHVPEESREQFIQGLQKFVSDFPLGRKRAMARAFLELPPDASIGKIVAAASVHAGPLFVKLLQLLRNYSPLDMQMELRVLLDGLPPHLSRDEIEDMLDKNVPESVRKRIHQFSSSPISVASLGQVHSMVLELPSGKVVKAVVKFIAPKFRQMIQEDLQSLEKSMGHFRFGSKLVQSVRQVMDEEINLRTEAEYTRAGAAMYRDPYEGIDVVDILQGEDFPLTENMEAQVFALGKPLTKISKKAIQDSGVSETDYNIYLSRALISYMKKWFRNAIFEKHRLAHADSHRGNLFFNIERTTSRQQKPYRLTVIDFGSMSKMSKEEAEAVILIGQGLFLSQTSDIMKGFYQLSAIANGGQVDPAEEEKLEKLREFVESRTEDYVSMHKRFTQIAYEALKLQIDFPTSFLQFNRGRIFIENLIAETLDQLKTSSDPRAQAEFKKLEDSFDIYMATSLYSILREVLMKAATLGRVDSVTSIRKMTAGSMRKWGNVLHTLFEDGPSATIRKEVYPFAKNLYDLANAVKKEIIANTKGKPVQ